MPYAFIRPEYLYSKEYAKIEGWLNDGAAWATYFISEYQIRNRVNGDIAEIGVHHRKYFILLSLLRADREKAIAVDIFEDQHLNVDKSGKGDYSRFIDNFLSIDGRPDGLIVHKRDSLTLPGCDLSKESAPKLRFKNRHVRLFSVDGSHTAKHTKNDILIAFDSLKRRGIVIIDDFYNASWPGVQEGVHSILSEREDICAVAYGDNKLFLIQSEDYEFYHSYFVNEFVEFCSSFKIVEMHGRKVVHFAMGDPRSQIAPDMSRRWWRTTFGRSGVLAVALGRGWSTPESNGAWINGNRASASVRVPAELQAAGSPIRISLTLYPLTHEDRLSRRVVVRCLQAGQKELQLSEKGTVDFEIASTKDTNNIDFVFDAETPDRISSVHPNSTDDRAVSLFVGNVLIEPIERKT